MKEHELAETIATIIRADAAFAGHVVRTKPHTDAAQPHQILVSALVEHFDASGRAGAASITVEIHSEAHDRTASGHADIVEKVRVKFFGANAAAWPAARAAIKAAVADGGQFALAGAGHSSVSEVREIEVDGDRIVSEVRLSATVLAA